MSYKMSYGVQDMHYTTCFSSGQEEDVPCYLCVEFTASLILRQVINNPSFENACNTGFVFRS